MIRLKLSDIAALLDCTPPENDCVVDNIATDSRKIHYGSLFAALPGSQVDGHDFASSAVELGATALLLNRNLDLDIPQLVVEDVLQALGKLAGMLRDRLDPLVVGITGSNGKTTVKEMVANILRQDGDVLATRGNYNNELGVPLSLELRENHDYAVLELGASQAGDIQYLASIAKPIVGVVTNVGPAHLLGLGNEDGVARAKGELFAALPANGWAIINGDQPWFNLWREMNNAGHSLSFGTAKELDVRLDHADGKPRIITEKGSFNVKLSLPGEHNLMNAAAATAVAVALNIPLDQIRHGLESVKPVPGRLNMIRCESGWTVIDDTYNANPASLYSALQVLANMQGTAWLVLGDMKELGENSRKLHAEVGDAARSLGVSKVFTIGEMSEFTAIAFGEGATHFQDRDSLVGAVGSELRSGIICLVKGSRSMGMETVVEAITQTPRLREVI
jgi:UDP-N-acetylmuramoyl-tripeptide--D-alanyl-D-alanine ligase